MRPSVSALSFGLLKPWPEHGGWVAGGQPVFYFCPLQRQLYRGPVLK